MDDSRNRACSTPTAFSSRFYRTVLFWLPLAGTKYEPITKSCCYCYCYLGSVLSVRLKDSLLGSGNSGPKFGMLPLDNWDK